MQKSITELQSRLDVAKNRLSTVQNERNDLFHKKRSYISFDALFTLIGFAWVVFSGIVAFSQIVNTKFRGDNKKAIKSKTS